MMRYRADWILPISRDPLRDGWVGVESGRIVALGCGDAGEAVDLGRAVILPGLVNAHTHLELSYLRNRVPPVGHFIDWVRQVMRRRREYPDPDHPDIVEAARAGIREARAAGTAAVGDISNTLVTAPLLAEVGLPAVVFYELLKFDEPDPAGRVQRARQQLDALPSTGGVRMAIAPHAPYSVSPGLFRAIRSDLDRHPHAPSSVHLGESIEELEFIRTGGGPWRTLLQELGVWTDAWKAPGTTPAAYLADTGFLDRRVLAVHGVHFTASDLARLAAIGVTVVSCPRSNRHVGTGPPPLEAFYASGLAVAFGTDSLASVEDLNLFGELAEARRLAPGVPARRLLESATLTGARALGFARELGSIEPGKRAALVAVSLPERVADVEEYLLSGITPAAIRWLDGS